MVSIDLKIYFENPVKMSIFGKTISKNGNTLSQ
jgi:hypothetical protein